VDTSGDQEQPAFDDGFVGGGPVELSAAERAAEQARRAAADRAKALRDEQFEAARSDGKRRRRRAGHRRLWKGSQTAAVLAGIAAAGWWFLGHPGYQRTYARATPVNESGPPGVTLPANVTTTTQLELSNFDYPPGSCVTWDQSTPVRVGTTRVPCGQSHLVEVVSQSFEITGFGTDYPGGELGSWYQQHCTAPAEAFLGYALDPHGRFGAGAVGPTPADWAQGDRTAWCTLQLPSTSPQLPSFSGEVRGADQEMLYPVGSCGSTTAAPVPCAATHLWQITGNVDVTATTALPATEAAWSALVGSQCGALGTDFLGGTFPPGVQTAWLTLNATSWSLGERTVQCTVGRFPPNGGASLPMTGSLAKGSSQA
jgi:hypothetical protein